MGIGSAIFLASEEEAESSETPCSALLLLACGSHGTISAKFPTPAPAGKTTFIRLLAGMIKPDDHFVELPEFNVSYKPQKISPKFPSTVRNLLHKRIRDAYLHPQFVTDVMRPMQARCTWRSCLCMVCWNLWKAM